MKKLFKNKNTPEASVEARDNLTSILQIDINTKKTKISYLQKLQMLVRPTNEIIKIKSQLIIIRSERKTFYSVCMIFVSDKNEGNKYQDVLGDSFDNIVYT